MIPGHKVIFRARQKIIKKAPARAIDAIMEADHLNCASVTRNAKTKRGTDTKKPRKKIAPQKRSIQPMILITNFGVTSSPLIRSFLFERRSLTKIEINNIKVGIATTTGIILNSILYFKLPAKKNIANKASTKVKIK